MVDKLKIRKDSRLYRFLKNGSPDKVCLDLSLFKEALELLSKVNDPEIFFAFEDRLIEEVIDLARHGDRAKAKEEINRICRIVESEIKHDHHVAPFLISIRNSVRSAARAAIYCLG